MDENYSCPNCGKLIPSLNAELHAIRCNVKKVSLPVVQANEDEDYMIVDESDDGEIDHNNGNIIDLSASPCREVVPVLERTSPASPAVWCCSACTFGNGMDAGLCEMCQTSRESSVTQRTSRPPPSPILFEGNSWECPSCTFRNICGLATSDSSAIGYSSECAMCQQPRLVDVNEMEQGLTADNGAFSSSSVPALSSVADVSNDTIGNVFGTRSSGDNLSASCSTSNGSSSSGAPQTGDFNRSAQALLLGAMGGATIAHMTGHDKTRGALLGAGLAGIMDNYLFDDEEMEEQHSRDIRDTTAFLNQPPAAAQRRRLPERSYQHPYGNFFRQPPQDTRTAGLHEQLDVGNMEYNELLDIFGSGAPDNSAPEHVVAQLPEYTYQDSSSLYRAPGTTNKRSEGEKDTCTICRDPYVNGDVLKRLPCLHGFHTQCIETWFKVSNTCPICKHAIS